MFKICALFTLEFFWQVFLRNFLLENRLLRFGANIQIQFLHVDYGVLWKHAVAVATLIFIELRIFFLLQSHGDGPLLEEPPRTGADGLLRLPRHFPHFSAEPPHPQGPPRLGTLRLGPRLATRAKTGGPFSCAGPRGSETS